MRRDSFFPFFGAQPRNLAAVYPRLLFRVGCPEREKNRGAVSIRPPRRRARISQARSSAPRGVVKIRNGPAGARTFDRGGNEDIRDEVFLTSLCGVGSYTVARVHTR